GLDVHLHAERLARVGHPLLEPAPAAYRDHHRERPGSAVLHAVDAFGFVVDLLPGHLVGRVHDVRPVGGVGQHAEPAVLPDREPVRVARAAPGEDDPAPDLLAFVVALLRARADVHEVGRDVGGTAVVGDRDPHLAVARELRLLRKDEPGLAGAARPGVAVPALPHELHVL